MPTLVQRFEEQVSRSPLAIACAHGEQSITYEKLNERANQLARYLGEQGVASQSLVGIYGERCIEFVIGVLAIIKAGGAYVPLDSINPAFRLEEILKDSGVNIVLASHEPNVSLPQRISTFITIDEFFSQEKDYPKENVRLAAHSKNLGYVLYTSSTKGKPKGIMISQAAIINLVTDKNCINLSEENTIIHLSNLALDTAAIEIWGALLHGAKLEIIDDNKVQDFPSVKKILDASKKSCCILTGALFEEMILGDPAQFKGCEYVFFTGESCNASIIKSYANQTEQTNLPKHLISVYGAIECAGWVTYYRISKENNYENIPLGRLLQNMSMQIIDEKLKPVAQSKVGELYVGGVGLSLGYLNQEVLTKESFIEKNGERLYRTGDLAKKSPNGEIEYQGRIDDRFTIGAFRVEPGEIEYNLKEVPDIENAVVTVEKNKTGEKELVAYLMLAKKLIRTLYNGPCNIKWSDESIVSVNVVDLSQGGICIFGADRKAVHKEKLSVLLPELIGKEEIQGEVIWQSQEAVGIHFLESNKKIEKYIDKYFMENFDVIPQRRNFKSILSKKLPFYMIPSRYIVLSNFPLTKKSDFDKEALRKIYEKVKEVSSEEILRNEKQSASEEMMIQLWRETIVISDQMTYSSLSKKITDKLKEDYHTSISIQDFFTNPTLSQLGVFVGQNLERSKYEPMATVLRAQHLPLSFAQEKVWNVDNNVSLLFQFKGTLSIEVLEHGIQELKKRHEILNTTYTATNQGKVYQVIKRNEPIEVKNIDISEVNNADKKMLDDFFIQENERRFVCDVGPLFRVLHIKINESNHILVFTFHKSIIDSRSLNILKRDLSEFYNASLEKRSPVLPALPIQYIDYAVWQRDELQSGKKRYADLIEFWKKLLLNAPVKLNLPLDFERKNNIHSRMGTVDFIIDKKLKSALDGFSINARCTLFMTLLASFFSVLSKISNENDIVIGTPVYNRDRTEIENLIGLFEKYLPIRIDSFSDMSFSKLIQEVKKKLLECYQNQELPLEVLIKELGLENNSNVHPVFQVLFSFESNEEVNFNFRECKPHELKELNKQNSFDLIVNLKEKEKEKENEIKGHIQFPLDLFKEETIIQWAQKWVLILQQISSNHQIKIRELGEP